MTCFSASPPHPSTSLQPAEFSKPYSNSTVYRREQRITSAQRAWSDNNAMDYRAANVYKPQDHQPNDCDKGLTMTPGLRTEGTPGDRRIAEPSDAPGHRGSDDTEMKPADYSTSSSPENGADQVEGTADADMTHEDDASEGSDGSVSTGDDEESPLENPSTNIRVSMVLVLFL